MPWGEEIIGGQGLKLLRPLKQKMQLRGQRMAALVLVEAFQKGVLFGLFQQQGITQGLPEALGEAGLAHADGAFHRDALRNARAHGAECLAGRRRRRLRGRRSSRGASLGTGVSWSSW